MADTGSNSLPGIEVQNLSYKFQDGSDGLENVQMSLPPGSRTLLIGGKSISSLYTQISKTNQTPSKWSGQNDSPSSLVREASSSQ
jgi:ABC-type phosphate/phosphonate transport system ATPase subunit